MSKFTDLDIAMILFVLSILIAMVCFSAIIGYGCGTKNGYTQALDDIRLGNKPRYKLVQTAEKWVEVEK